MKRKYWWIFGVVQVAGTLAAIETPYVGLISSFWMIVPFLLLLPGSLTWLPMMRAQYFGVGRSYIFWTSAVALTVNLLLFTATSFLVSRLAGHRKPD